MSFNPEIDICALENEVDTFFEELIKLKSGLPSRVRVDGTKIRMTIEDIPPNINAVQEDVQ